MISIIIPIYNSAPYLRQCLDSVIGQSYSNLEIICIDDGSSDESPDILREYSSRDNRVVVFTRENRGISYSRNEGLAFAHGEWIMFVDSDDWIDYDCCSRAHDIAVTQNCDVVMWAYTREFKSMSLPKFYLKEKKEWSGSEVIKIHRRIFGPVNEELAHPECVDAFGTVWAKLYRCRYAKRVEFTDTKIIGSAEDVLYNAIYFRYATKVIYIPYAMYHYRKYSSSFTTKGNRELPEKWENLYNRLEEIINKFALPNIYKKALDNRISLGIIGLGLNELYDNTSLRRKYIRIKYLIKRSRFKCSINKLATKCLPYYWNLFFLSVKQRRTLIVLFMLLAIKKISEK